MHNLDNETIYLEFRDKMSREELEELFASKAISQNPGMANNVMVFEKLCLALNGVIPSFDHVEEPSMTMVCGALVKMKKLGIDVTLLSETVKKYIACVGYNDGFVILPRIASFSQSFLDRLTSDYGKSLFADMTLEKLETQNIANSDDPIDNHCAKIQLVEAYLEGLN